MELDPTTSAGVVAVLAGVFGVVLRRGWKKFARWLLSELALYVVASSERSRRRDRKERPRARTKPGEVPVWVDPDGEITDVFKLVEEERSRRSRRETEDPPVAPRQRGGTRHPRRGTHHDGEDE